MEIATTNDSPVNRRGGQVSYLLLSPGRIGSRNLVVTLVEGDRGSEQPLHRHEFSEQAYVIVEGRGLMTVGDEQAEVSAGMLVFIPPGKDHNIRNLGDTPLKYVSAAAPPMDLPGEGSPLLIRDRRIASAGSPSRGNR